MSWVESISSAIAYIEKNIAEDVKVEQVARAVHLSPFYFQKGFAMLCGLSVGEYVRLRRLTIAGGEVLSTDSKIIDIAVKYGYDSADGFTKAFTRFHGATPTAVRNEGAAVKSFAPLSIKFTLEGGKIMDYKIMKKSAFTVIGVAGKFPYSEAKDVVPKFWQDYFASGKRGSVCGMFGVNIDEKMDSSGTFEYLIADVYNPAMDIADGLVTRVIPEFTWAVFPCKGKMVETLQNTNIRIFSEWLPSCVDYEIAAGYNIEMYSDPQDFPNGADDENYYCEIWVPVKRK